MEYVIGIDVGGTNFRIGAVSNDGQVVGFEQKYTSSVVTGDVVESFVAEIKSYIYRNDLFGKVEALVIGLPSVVSKDKSYVYNTPNLKGIDNIDLGNELSKCLELKVIIERDVNLLLYHDIEKYNLDKERKKTVLGFYIGTGFGNAIYIEGKSYKGSNGSAGELGHIPMYGLDEKCPCGNTGCIEIRCSGKYLLQLVSENFKDTNIDNVFTLHRDHSIIVDYVKSLAIPIVTEVNILDPDIIILSGGVLFTKDFPKELLLHEIQNKLRKPYPYINLKIVFAEHNQDSGVIGGASYFKNLKV
ncbi:allose kinase [Alkalibaculum sp. M08DMB]|uniref:Allose kinase n=1 Tax=Alkalibaculum sporogenes TaxID=2655001 RepID=A0A6A7K4X0_9FIRM|nr:allose kinase [Alkalibaculum sporogenes]MPW24425.1 allose kinase [Alkalibaculum sporogenes]